VLNFFNVFLIYNNFLQDLEKRIRQRKLAFERTRVPEDCYAIPEFRGNTTNPNWLWAGWLGRFEWGKKAI
jgi:hypothetical protein